MAKKTRKKRKVKKAKRSSKKRTMAKKRRRSTRRSASGGFRRAKSGFGNVLKSGIVGKVVLGIGAATLVGLVVDRFAPQFSPIARPVAALIAGGPIGAVGSVLLSGGLNLGGFLGGGANGAGGEAV